MDGELEMEALGLSRLTCSIHYSSSYVSHMGTLAC